MELVLALDYTAILSQKEGGGRKNGGKKREKEGLAKTLLCLCLVGLELVLVLRINAMHSAA